jgi:hypothetical protein
VDKYVSKLKMGASYGRDLALCTELGKKLRKRLAIL